MIKKLFKGEEKAKNKKSVETNKQLELRKKLKDRDKKRINTWKSKEKRKCHIKKTQERNNPQEQ